MTIAIGVLCLYGLGTPSDVPWMSIEEKRMANTRILENQSGHDKTGTMVWKWYQVWECLVDPCVRTFGWFIQLRTVLTSFTVLFFWFEHSPDNRRTARLV